MTGTLGDLTWEGAAGRGDDVILSVPLGATEQHGPHLPLSTDTEIAVALSSRLAAERPEVLVAPAVPFGSSGEHAGFAGTLSIGQSALERLLVELGRDATRTFMRVLLICAHGGNAAPVARAVAALRAEGRDVRAFFPAWPGDAHAGRTETSLMLAIRPSGVLADRAAAGAVAPLASLLGALQTVGVAAVSANGVLGDPSGASAEEGHALLSEAVAQLVAAVEGWS